MSGTVLDHLSSLLSSDLLELAPSGSPPTQADPHGVVSPFSGPSGGKGFERISMGQQIEGSDYNQGCDGGDPMLAGMWLQEVPAVSESCWSVLRKVNNEDTRLQLQQTHPKCRMQLQVSQYGYTGGSIGACGLSSVCEEIMMREL